MSHLVKLANVTSVLAAIEAADNPGELDQAIVAVANRKRG